MLGKTPMIVTRFLSAGLLAVCVLAAATTATAEEAIQAYRESVMMAVGGHTTALAAIVKNEVAFEGDLVAHAMALDRLAKMTDHIFPKGSGGGDSESLPAIWDQPEKFKKAIRSFQDAASDLAAVAGDGPKAAAPAVGALAKSCKSCHDDFRKKS